MNISKDTAVTIHYTITDAQGKRLDDGDVAYLHGGYDNLFAKVEEALEGKSVGDSLTVDLAVEDAFGARDESLKRSIPKAEFPPGRPKANRAPLGGQRPHEVRERGGYLRRSSARLSSRAARSRIWNGLWPGKGKVRVRLQACRKSLSRAESSSVLPSSLRNSGCHCVAAI